MKIKSIVLIAGLVLGAGAGWHKWGSQATQVAGKDSKISGKPGEMPPVLVTTNLSQRKDVPVVVANYASVHPQANVDLRPQLSSTIAVVHVKEGEHVNAGQLLFSLDQRNELANLDKARAQLARDQATLQDLERQFKRSQQLVAQQFITQGSADTLSTQIQAQKASINLALANVQSARIALDNTRISAPMAGRIGAINVFPGSLVQPASSLAQIARIHPIQVSFTVPEVHLPSLLAAQKNGLVTVHAQPLSGGAELQGKLVFIDNAVDSQAGLIRLKAEFNNQQQHFWPGQSVQTKVTVGTMKDAIVVPLAAIITNARGRAVYTLNSEQRADLRPISLLYQFGDQAVISGIAAGEKVVVEGRQNLRPGGKTRQNTDNKNPQDKSKNEGKDKAGKPASASSSTVSSANSSSKDAA